MYQLNKEKDSMYAQEYDFRTSIFSKYHDTASIAGIYKYEQAKELLNDPDASAVDVARLVEKDQDCQTGRL